MITNLPPVLSPEQIQSQINAWTPIAAVMGAAGWHLVLKVAPWARANGGVIRGVRDFFWTVKPQPPQPQPKPQ